MINPAELRIGNWIQSGRIEPKIGQVRHITLAGTIAIDKYGGRPASDCYPVPLTESILIACGFERTPDDYFIILFADEVDKDLDWRMELCKRSDGQYVVYVNGEWIRPISPLHQLQNIFHSLTGEEIIYKP